MLYIEDMDVAFSGNSARQVNSKEKPPTIQTAVSLFLAITMVLVSPFFNIAHGVTNNISNTESSIKASMIYFGHTNSRHRVEMRLKQNMVRTLKLTMGDISTDDQIKKRQQKSTYSPIIVNLEISKAPRLDEVVIVKLKIKSAFKAKNTIAAIILPEAAIKVGGNLNWKGDLSEGIPVELTVRIKFVKEGNWTLKGYAKHIIDKDNFWGDADYIYLNVMRHSGMFGFPGDKCDEKLIEKR